MVVLLVDDCSIQEMLTCPVGAFLGKATGVQPGKTATPKAQGTRPLGSQPLVNTSIPPLCQKVVGAFNKAYPTLTVSDLCRKGGVKFFELQTGKRGGCLNFGLLGRCKGCTYKHKVYTIPEERQAQIAKEMERGMAAMKAAA
jgi:hypothetical protein